MNRLKAMRYAIKVLILIGTYAVSWSLAYVSVKRWDFEDFFRFLRSTWTTDSNAAADIIQIMAVGVTLMVAVLMWYIPRVRKEIAKHATKA
jgi:hypothetical protein